LACTQVLGVGDSQVDFVVRWRTEEWSDPSLLEANIWDWGLDEGCPTFGADPGTTFTYGDTGVETEIVPVIDGGYMNSIRFSGGRCATVCEYLYKSRGWILDDGNLATITNTKSVKVEYCVQ